ncbi:unnamed protein product [Ectocarpus sp. 13 AM-2016]
MKELRARRCYFAIQCWRLSNGFSEFTPNVKPALLVLCTMLLTSMLQEAGLNGHSDESRAWNGTSDVDRESVLSMTMESEASNVAVKGTESSEGDIAGAHTDDDEDSEP